MKTFIFIIEFQEQDIPININTDKLSDFLISRRIVNKNWPNAIQAIRDNIAHALQDMPEHEELVKLLSGAHINYFHCRRILEILKKTEADTKNLFGRYSSSRYTNWQDVIKAYERESVYIAEAAQIYARNVQYEIPGTKRQIAKLEQMEEESYKKVQDLNKSENNIRNEYQALCDQFKVKGDNIKQDLIHSLDRLPIAYGEISRNVPSLLKAVNLYGSFCNNKDCLPVIRHIASSGNTTVYQYIYGEPPLSIEEPPVTFLADESNDKPDLVVEEIDFGDIGGEINLEVGDIDWGIAEEIAPDIQENPVDIDVNISLEESGIVVESAGCSGGIAKGNEAYTLLDSPKYRDHFIDELYEVS